MAVGLRLRPRLGSLHPLLVGRQGALRPLVGGAGLRLRLLLPSLRPAQLHAEVRHLLDQSLPFGADLLLGRTRGDRLAARRGGRQARRGELLAYINACDTC